MARRAHKGQYRDTGEEYIIHPIEVYRLLRAHNLPRYVCIAGFLHDTLEDTNLNEEEIEHLGGEKCLGLVQAVTKIKNADNIQRIVDYAKTTDANVILLKLADRVHNTRTMQNWKKDRIEKYRHETRAIIVHFTKNKYLFRTEMQCKAFDSFVWELVHFVKQKAVTGRI